MTGNQGVLVTEPGADAAQVPAATQAEFGKRPMEDKVAQEMATLEAQLEAQLKGEPAPATVAPVAPVAAAPEVPAPAVPPAPIIPASSVPEKFRTPDGSLDTDKLAKSTVELERYLAAEREMSQRRQAPEQPQIPQLPPGWVAVPAQSLPQGQAQYPSWGVPAAAPADADLERRLNEDLSRNPGQAVLGLTRAAVDAMRAEAAAPFKEMNMRMELMDLARRDARVATYEGLDALKAVRAANPWLASSPTPWTHAYELSQLSKTQTQAPRTAAAPGYAGTPGRPSAPILPGGAPPAPMSGVVNATSEAELRRTLEAKFPKDPAKQAAFLEGILMASSKRGG